MRRKAHAVEDVGVRVAVYTVTTVVRLEACPWICHGIGATGAFVALLLVEPRL